MLGEKILDASLDALLDSLYVLIALLIINFLVSFFEEKLADNFAKKRTLSPLLGSSIGLIPQCGFSIVASDLYLKNHISMGTLVAVFVACSDEALPIMLSHPNKALMIIPLLGLKFIIGFVYGFVIDIIIQKINRPKSFDDVVVNYSEEINKGCCNHNIEKSKRITKKTWCKNHLIHPLVHSLKIFVYVLVINLFFNILFNAIIGEDLLSQFLISNKYITPLLTCLFGLIPNCASSVIISELFVQESISFGATLCGLICNAGLGLIYLLKSKKKWKDTLIIIALLILIALLSGYITLFIESLF